MLLALADDAPQARPPTGQRGVFASVNTFLSELIVSTMYAFRRVLGQRCI